MRCQWPWTLAMANDPMKFNFHSKRRVETTTTTTTTKKKNEMVIVEQQQQQQQNGTKPKRKPVKTEWKSGRVCRRRRRRQRRPISVRASLTSYFPVANDDDEIGWSTRSLIGRRKRRHYRVLPSFFSPSTGPRGLPSFNWVSKRFWIDWNLDWIEKKNLMRMAKLYRASKWRSSIGQISSRRSLLSFFFSDHWFRRTQIVSPNRYQTGLLSPRDLHRDYLVFFFYWVSKWLPLDAHRSAVVQKKVNSSYVSRASFFFVFVQHR